MSSPLIRVLFIRKNNSSKTDDSVVIRRLGANQFNLSYTYGDSTRKTPHQLVLTDKAVFRWVRNTIRLLEKDAEPFESVQLDLPFMPSVIFDVPKLDDVYHTILDAIEFHLDNWPSPPAPAYEDEDDEIDEEEYADLPPLVRAPSPMRGSHHLFLDGEY